MKRNTSITLLLLFLISINLEAQTLDDITKLYASKDYSNVIELGQKILQNDSENPQLNMIVGRAFADRNKHKEAIPYLMKGTLVNNNPAWVRAWSFAYLGTCYYVVDNFVESKRNFKECIQLNATKNATQFAKKYISSLQMSDNFDAWKTVEKEHLRFHFQETENIRDVENFMTIREDAFVEINKFFHAKPFKKIDYFIWDKPEEAKTLFGRELGFANSKLCIINSRNNQTVGHEMTHILSDFGIQPSQKTKLINEGLAVCFDQTNRDRMEVARTTLRNKKIDIIDLWNNPEKYPNDYFYTIGGALIDFLLKHGTESQLKQLLKNQTAETAFMSYDNFQDLIAGFEQELVK